MNDNAPQTPLSSAQAQALAADPAGSVFVTANAGSGKTKTLIDRVARLLLAGVQPATILCVTYTKAAAAEMQRRLYARLGGWSIKADEALLKDLHDLEGAPFAPGRLSEARALFARALETPGGLKIQTLHAFCEQLLRRFPLEAGVSPAFRVADDTAAAAIAAAARARVARAALSGAGAVGEAYARLSVALDLGSFDKMFGAIAACREALAEFVAREDGPVGVRAWVWRACGLRPGDTAETVERDAIAGLDFAAWAAAAEVLDVGNPSDVARAAALRACALTPTLEDAKKIFVTQKAEPATWVHEAAVMKRNPAISQGLAAEQAKVTDALSAMASVAVAQDSADVLILGQAYLMAYEAEKSDASLLDFADLVAKARALLTKAGQAAWVLYKLDGGMEHILVDEAQDTAPEQWDIVTALTEEFFAGAGRRGAGDPDRTLFVVGDEKQSIYSFQGADPRKLQAVTEAQLARITAAGRPAREVRLEASWRSAQEVLTFVDATFVDGVAPTAGPLVHLQERRDSAGGLDKGCVDLWPLVHETKGDAADAWAPVDASLEDSANAKLARAIACEIEATVKRGDAVFDRDHTADDGSHWRPATFGDVIILVRRRGGLFDELLRALKKAGVPVAGADRLKLSEHIVFDDLMALIRFVQFPGDDLTLAALLKSPFCGLSDDDLYALAHGRTGTLWARVLAEAPAPVRAFLTWSREGAALRPYEFLVRALARIDANGRSMRAAILTRLGREAEEALDEFLAQVLAAEARGVRDMESLAADFASLDITVKREGEGGRDEVRVMTAHGAKGLEAPIIFLPETTIQSAGRGSLLKTEAVGDLGAGFLWCASAKRDCEASKAARAWRDRLDEEESLRLLYVALTRARDRLVLCGRMPGNIGEEARLKGWWKAMRAGFDQIGVKPHVRAVNCAGGDIQRFGPDPRPLGRPRAVTTTLPNLAAWARTPAPPEPLARYASPSQTAGGLRAPAPSPLARTDGLGRFRRGDLIHRLLQILPDLAPEARPDGARRLLAREPDLNPAQAEEMVRAALGVLADPAFAEVFGPGSRAEVALAGSAAALPPGLVVSGRLDRLVVLPDRVLVADFKTNRPAPSRIEDADPAYLSQMAIYAAVLADIFPGRAIEAALVWTDGPKLMPIPEKLLAEALAGLGVRR